MAPFDHLLPLQERSGGCTVLTLQKKWQTFNYCLFIYFLHKKKWSTQTRKKQKTLCGDVTVAKGRGQVGSHVQGTIYLLNIETGERWSENDWLHGSTMSTTWSIQPSVSEGVGYSVLSGVARFRSLRSFWSIIDRVLLKVKQEVRHEQNEVWNLRNQIKEQLEQMLQQWTSTSAVFMNSHTPEGWTGDSSHRDSLKLDTEEVKHFSADLCRSFNFCVGNSHVWADSSLKCGHSATVWMLTVGAISS